MLKLKLWSPDAKRQLIRKDPMLGKIEGKRRKGWQRKRWLESIIDSVDMNLSNQEIAGGQRRLEGCCWVAKSQIPLNYHHHHHHVTH